MKTEYYEVVLKKIERKIEASNVDRNGTLFDVINYLQQYEKIVIASRAKKLEKTHDPLQLVAHTSSSRSSLSYCVTHPSFMVDYDDEYQGNKAVVQADSVNIQSRNIGNDGRIARRLNVSNVQCYNCNEKGYYARNCPKPRVWDSKYFMEQMLLAKKDEAGVILSNEQNDFLFADTIQMQELVELSANICMMAIIQPVNVDYGEGPSYDSKFIREVQTPSTSYLNDDHEQTDKIRALEQERDALQLKFLEQMKKILELQNAPSVLKRKMNANEDKYLDGILNLEVKVKTNKNFVTKMSQSVQALFMLGPKPLSFYDPKLKHGLGYENPYTLKKEIAHNLKLYDAFCLNNSKMHVNVCDTEEILEDATKSQIKMENKLKDPIAIEKKHNFHSIDYKKLNALYKMFVPQKELSVEQKYFPSVSMTSETSSNASTSSSLPVTMPKSSKILKHFHRMERDFESDLDATWKQNEILNDELLEATLKYDVEKYVLMCSDFVNDNLDVEIEKDATSVRRPLSRGSLSKNSVLSHIKSHSADVEVHIKSNKKTNVASKKNVVQNKKNVTNVDVKNAPKAKDVLCVSCAKNILIPCHDSCLAKYKLNMHSNVRRALFTTPRTTTPKSLDTTSIVTKTRFAVVTPLSAKTKDSYAFRSNSLFAQVISLSKYMRNKIKTSQKWQKWYETQSNVGWTLKRLNDNEKPSVVRSRNHEVSSTNIRVTIRRWVPKPCTLPFVVFSCNAGGSNSYVDC
ncbi:retrovirus-related pol polyprotein from transposon TNT 1-94 [Tanacetum coccineum]